MDEDANKDLPTAKVPLKEDEAVAMSYPLAYPPYSSRINMPLSFLVPVFTKHFAIAQFDEKGEPIFVVNTQSLLKIL